MEVVQRKLGPISRGGGIFEAVLLLFLEFPGKFVNFGSFSSFYFRPLSPAASPRTGRPRRSCGGSLSNSWGCRTYDGLPQKNASEKHIFILHARFLGYA